MRLRDPYWMDASRIRNQKGRMRVKLQEITDALRSMQWRMRLRQAGSYSQID